MGLFGSKQVIVPLQTVEHVDVAELERISKRIETVIQICSAERDLIRNTYKSTNVENDLSSCQAQFKFDGNHEKTFALLQNRFQKRAKLQLATAVFPDPDDDMYHRGPAYFYESSIIKVVV